MNQAYNLIKIFRFFGFIVISLIVFNTALASSNAVEQLYQTIPSNIDGNPNGQITLIEFFDYRCKACKQLAPRIEKLIEENPDLRVIYRPYPILGAASESAARASLAASHQGRYLAFHKLLIQNQEPFTSLNILRLAKHAYINPKQLVADLDSDTTTEALQYNIWLAKIFNVSGLPTVFIGKTRATNKQPTRLSGNIKFETLSLNVNR